MVRMAVGFYFSLCTSCHLRDCISLISLLSPLFFCDDTLSFCIESRCYLGLQYRRNEMREKLAKLDFETIKDRKERAAAINLARM
jgi:hypothetical protein